MTSAEILEKTARTLLDEINVRRGGSSYARVELGEEAEKEDVLKMIIYWGKLVIEQGDMASEGREVEEAANALLDRYFEDKKKPRRRGEEGLNIQEVGDVIRAWNAIVWEKASEARKRGQKDKPWLDLMEEPSDRLKEEVEALKAEQDFERRENKRRKGKKK